MAAPTTRTYGRDMKFSILLLVGAVLHSVFAGCYSGGTSQRGRPQRDGAVHLQTSVAVYEDDYDYYPGYEVYYSRNRDEYVYRDGSQ